MTGVGAIGPASSGAMAAAAMPQSVPHSADAGGLAQLGGALGQQVAGLVHAAANTPRNELLGALLLALLLDRSSSDDDRNSKHSATDLFAALALLSASQGQGFAFSMEWNGGGMSSAGVQAASGAVGMAINFTA